VRLIHIATACIAGQSCWLAATLMGPSTCMQQLLTLLAAQWRQIWRPGELTLNACLHAS
jgi:hypothetical protein